MASACSPSRRILRLSERRASGGEASARSATTGRTPTPSRSTIAWVLWHCFACSSGGDLVRLVELWGTFSVSEAVAWLGHTYGIDLPERPESWYRKQSRQARLRQAVIEERREIKRRRLFKYLILPEIEKLPEADQAREAERAWERFKKVPMAFLDNHGALRD